MRKVLVALLIVAGLAAFWLWRGRDLSGVADRFKTIVTSSRPVAGISYEGAGSGGVLQVTDDDLTLDETVFDGPKPNMGTTKDGQLALSFRGKVFPFGPVLSQNDKLAAKVPDADTATISIEHSALAWPNFFEVNFMTGNSPKWKRFIYRKLICKKTNGAKLEMVWRYEQYFYQGTGWTEAFMTRPGSTGLIRVEISDAPR